MPSPALASPCEASSYSGCVAEPPSALKFAVTVNPVDAGSVPGVTTAVRSVVRPAFTVDGLADAVSDGDVGVEVPPQEANAEESSPHRGNRMSSTVAE